MGTHSLSLEEIMSMIREFVKERDWEKFHKPSALAMSVSIELGELLELFQWKSDDEILESLKEKEYSDAVRAEVADVLIYTLRLADVMGVDVAKAIAEKMEKNIAKYPVEHWDGKAPSKLNRREPE